MYVYVRTTPVYVCVCVCEDYTCMYVYVRTTHVYVCVCYGKPNGSEFAWFSPPCDY